MSIMYDVINILPLSLLSVMLLGPYADIPGNSFTAFVLCLLFSVWTIALRNMKPKNRLRSIGIVSVFITGLLLAVGKERRVVFFEKYLWVIWILCFCAGAMAAGLILYRSIWLRRAEAAGFFVFSIIVTAVGQYLSKSEFALICFIILVRISEEIQRKWKKSGSTDMNDHVTRTAPFLAGLCFIVYLLPAPAEPFSWQFAKDLFYKTLSCFSRLFGSDDRLSDNYGVIGFTDEGGFLAGLGSSDDEVLYITTNNSSIKDIRLIGCISGEFGGRGWVFDTGSESTLRMTDTLETSAAVRKGHSSSRLDYLKKLDMSCESLLLNTKYIFSPAKIKMEESKEKTDGISDRNGSIIADSSLGYKDTYQIACYVFNYANPQLRRLLENAAPIEKDEWEQTVLEEGVSGMEEYSFEEYQQYRSSVYETFCHSYGVSDEVEEILDKIKSSAGSRYEAAKMLEEYLRKFRYSTDCGPLPESVSDAGSFLDYFLFSSQEGYCMHFSTAFVLMANEMGIPCRHVQGYSSEAGFRGSVIVRDSDAHAWPEVYFDNVGWIAFEPTPGHSAPVGWAVNDKDLPLPDKGEGDHHEDMQPKDLPDIPSAQEEKTGISPLIFIIPLLSVISFLLLFYTFSRLLAVRRYRRMNSRDKFRYLAQQNIRYIGYLGLTLEEGETLSEYSDKIKSAGDQALNEHLGFIRIYEALLYSDREVSDEDIASAEKSTRAVRGLVKRQSLRSRFMLLIKNQ